MILNELWLTMPRLDVGVLDQRLDYVPLESCRGLDNLTLRLREKAPA